LSGVKLKLLRRPQACKAA